MNGELRVWVRCVSTVRRPTKSACAISRLLRPSAAIRAVRSLLAVSASRPWSASRLGLAPAVTSSSRPAQRARLRRNGARDPSPRATARSLQPMPRPPQGRSELDQGPCVLQRCARAREHGDRLAKQVQVGGSRLDQPTCGARFRASREPRTRASVEAPGLRAGTPPPSRPQPRAQARDSTAMATAAAETPRPRAGRRRPACRGDRLPLPRVRGPADPGRDV